MIVKLGRSPFNNSNSVLYVQGTPWVTAVIPVRHTTVTTARAGRRITPRTPRRRMLTPRNPRRRPIVTPRQTQNGKRRNS